MVAVGFREGRANENVHEPIQTAETTESLYQHTSSLLIARLTHFVGAVSEELEGLNKELVRLSITDKLTGLANRTRLDEVIATELNRSERYSEPFAIILLDVDRFKSVNDTFGHLVGDEVLKEMANRLMENVRKSDVVGRWGGEEFIIVLPNSTLKQAVAVAEKLRQKIAVTPFDTAGWVTSSFGVSQYMDGESEDALLSRVDAALYTAKHNGHNRVEPGK